jgi:hypothetical protein
MSMTWAHLEEYAKSTDVPLAEAVRVHFLGKDHTAPRNGDCWTPIANSRNWTQKSNREELLFVVENCCGRKYQGYTKMAQVLRLILGIKLNMQRPYPYHSIEYAILEATDRLSPEGRMYLSKCYGHSGTNQHTFEDHIMQKRNWNDSAEVGGLLRYIQQYYDISGDHGCGALERIQGHRVTFTL